MHIDNARNLKAEIFRKILNYSELPGSAAATNQRPVFVDPRTIGATEESRLIRPRQADIALGLASADPARDAAPDAFVLAIFLRDRRLSHSELVERVRAQAKGETRLYVTGSVRKHASFPQSRTRPLAIGCSIGHRRISTGTIGCFVRLEGRPAGILSNNHVLADLNRAHMGDPILQPGRADDGRDPQDRIGNLLALREVQFEPSSVNRVDCAVASVFPNVKIDPSKLVPGMPVKRLSGRIEPANMLGARVWKVGRTTLVTEGLVEAIEVDQVLVNMAGGGPARLARFDGQIVISGSGHGAFSRPGDSGALIINAGGHAVGLLFAGSATGGRNGRGLTYANPIEDVLYALEAKIAID